MKAKIMFLAVAAALSDMAAAQTVPSNALPIGGAVAAGTATIGAPGTTTGGASSLTVTQGSRRAVINWSTFNVGSNAEVHFAQAHGASSITANRVPAATSQSVIDGLLSAPGNVMILNSQGVTFGASARVNVAGLIASTGDINSANGFADFMAGGPFAITAATQGSISNEGVITLSQAGLAAFVAPSVTNSGRIIAQGGRIRLASAEAITVSLNGGLYEIAVDQGINLPVDTLRVSNTGTLSATGGTIVLSALDAANIVSGVINLEGVQQANRIEVHGGEVHLLRDLNAATVTGSSTTIQVCGCTPDLQDAVDIAANGASINIASGTYERSSTLNVNKSVSIRGAGEAQTIIDASDVSGYGILVTADNVSLSRFTLYGPQANVGTSYGIKVQPGAPGAAARLHDFSISHVTSRAAGRAELDLNGVVGATIDHFTALGDNTAGAGIQITDSANVTISNSRTEGNNWGGVALFQANGFFNQQTTDISVDGQGSNTFTEALPLYLQDSSPSRNFGALTLVDFDYAVRTSSTVSNNHQKTFLQYELGNAVDVAVNLAERAQSYIQGWNGSASTQNFHVGVGNLSGGGTAAMSIMKAVNEAAPGATVNVGAGVYAENVVVNQRRDLTFDGATLQSLTLNASGSGIGGSATATGAGGFVFNAPVVLLSATSLGTAGANIVFNADVQNAGATPFALNLSAGSGDVLMVSGGSTANPLGHLDVAANNFSLAGTLWVSGYEIDAAGSVALSTSTLRSVGSSNAGSISAAGDITGSTVSEGAVDIQSDSSVLMTNIISSGPVTIDAAQTVVANVETPTQVVVSAGESVQLTGSAPSVVLDAPTGNVSGSFADVTNAGTGVIAVNGKAEVPQVLASSYDPSRIVPQETSSNAAPVAASEDDNVSFATSEEKRRGARLVRAAPQEAKAALDSGLGVELDLSPRNTR